MPYKTLVDLWPKPEYKDYPETIEQERARLKAGGIFELIERTEYQRVIRSISDDYIRVQGTQRDWELTVQAPCSLGESIAAMKQIAFYAINGVRIPETLADHFAVAVDAMASAYEKDENTAIDDAAVSRKCLNVLGKKLGILAGNRRPAVSFLLVGDLYRRIFEQVWSDISEAIAIAEKGGKYSADEISEMEDYEMEYAYSVAKEVVRDMFQLSNQQLDRYLEKYERWRDLGGDPP
jgi:hypothetical protein